MRRHSNHHFTVPYNMKHVAVILLGLLAAIAMAEEKFPGIENLMTAKEFQDAGLDHLNERELKALNAWLINYTAGTAAVLVQSNEEVKAAKSEAAIVSRIQGDFTGWTGETLFRLENGQIWRQRLSGRYKYSGPPNPEVSISRNFMGFYKMTVTETGKSIGVKLVN